MRMEGLGGRLRAGERLGGVDDGGVVLVAPRRGGGVPLGGLAGVRGRLGGCRLVPV